MSLPLPCALTTEVSHSWCCVAECSGGRQWSDCGGGVQCIATCSNTMPMCPRDCYEGCYCPPQTPVWHHDICITAEQCKGTTQSSTWIGSIHWLDWIGLDDFLIGKARIPLGSSRHDSTRSTCRASRAEPCCSNMADDEQAIVLPCTGFVVFAYTNPICSDVDLKSRCRMRYGWLTN